MLFNKILKRKKCKNCNFQFFLIQNKDHLFCSKDCYSSFLLKRNQFSFKEKNLKSNQNL